MATQSVTKLALQHFRCQDKILRAAPCTDAGVEGKACAEPLFWGDRATTCLMRMIYLIPTTTTCSLLPGAGPALFVASIRWEGRSRQREGEC
ncbi:hypothetical protein C0Q70_00772 [Pomacea canaliculata]|uniref:Uncharacterized protein n=1 Tax=Pomacea canaliculata TaxID=400727 RepID=A0A2T7PXK3_POMCA|nr:hypothetical protein C0Q70_00772 [Pomacea canaliculata]